MCLVAPSHHVPRYPLRFFDFTRAALSTRDAHKSKFLSVGFATERQGFMLKVMQIALKVSVAAGLGCGEVLLAGALKPCL
jgi:hypothetical protein